MTIFSHLQGSRKITLLFVFFIMSVLFIFTSANAVTLRVPQDFMTIQAAIDNTQEDDIVLVSPGEYFENINLGGRTITVASLYLNDPDPQFITNTVIDGMFNGRSIVNFRDGGNTLLIGFTLRNGSTDFGGGVYCRNSSPTLSNLIVENCQTTRNGAGIYFTTNSDVVIRDLIICNNHAGYVGGGFGLFGNSRALLENVLFYNNRADHVGAALHIHGSEMTLRNLTVMNNLANHNAGGIYMTNNSRVNMSNSIMRGNFPQQVYFFSWEFQNITVSFSNIEGGIDDIWHMEEREITWGAGNFDAEPRFMNPDAGNFNLAANSPCIDAGNPLDDPDPDGTRRDIGALFFDQGDAGMRVRRVPNQHQTIQQAVNTARNGDMILIAPGQYRGNFEVQDKDLIVTGHHFATLDPADAINTILDADGQGSALSLMGNIEQSLVYGLTISNGTGTFTDDDGIEGDFGGGIFCADGASIRVEKCHLTNNRCDGGGAIYAARNATVTIKNSSITNNSAENIGGGIAAASNARLFLENVTAIQNTAPEGGFIFARNAETIIQNSTLDFNDANVGGAIATLNGSLSMFRVLAYQNEAVDLGGALYLNGTDAELRHITFAQNSANSSGGGIALENASAILHNSITALNEPNEITLTEDGDGSIIDISYSLIMGGENLVETNNNGEVIWGEGCLDEDPQFTNTEENDFTLFDGSPCIDAGDPNSPLDPDRTRADLGALYYPHPDDRNHLIIIPDDYETIQAAINEVFNGDTILVRPGRYIENLDFMGKEIVVASMFLYTQDPYYIENTIIDGNQQGPTISFARQEGWDTSLIGFTITGGFSREAGGIFLFYSMPSITRCIITGNASEIGGGGLYMYNSSARLQNVTIANNTSNEGSGAFYVANTAWPDLRGCILWHNSAPVIAFHFELDPCGFYAAYCNIEGGEDNILVQNSGSVNIDENSIVDDPLFTNWREGDYSLQEDSPCIDTGDPRLDLDPDGTDPDMGAIYFEQRQEITFDIQLNAGWNLISLPVQPLPNVSMIESIWEEIVSRGSLSLFKSQDGSFYYPDGNFNNIETWDFRYGYMARMYEPEQISINGFFVNADTPIPIETGWSMISYFPTRQHDAPTATALLGDTLEIIKDGTGRFYIPRWNFSNLEPMRQGRGYKIRVNYDVNLVWNNPENVAVSPDKTTKEPQPQHFVSSANLPDNHSILITKLEQKSEYLTELGVFTRENICIGSTVLYSDGPWGLAVWGNEKVKSGQNMVFKTYSNGIEHVVTPTFIQGDSVWMPDGLSVISLNSDLLPREFALEPIYPNPFNNRAVIRYSLPQSDVVKLIVYDINGRQAATLWNGYTEAGWFEQTWIADDFPSGLYLIKLSTPAKSATIKALLLK